MENKDLMVDFTVRSNSNMENNYNIIYVHNLSSLGANTQ